MLERHHIEGNPAGAIAATFRLLMMSIAKKQ
jgi:hypothetical protein